MVSSCWIQKWTFMHLWTIGPLDLAPVPTSQLPTRSRTASTTWQFCESLAPPVAKTKSSGVSSLRPSLKWPSESTSHTAQAGNDAADSGSGRAGDDW